MFGAFVPNSKNVTRLQFSFASNLRRISLECAPLSVSGLAPAPQEAGVSKVPAVSSVNALLRLASPLLLSFHSLQAMTQVLQPKQRF